MKRLYAIVKLLRPEQWVKNGFVFIPLFFDQKLFCLSCLIPTSVAFLAFCFMSSAVYCLNDIQDVDRDRRHPKKRNRPIASGAIPLWTAKVMMILCIIVSLLTTLLLPDMATLTTEILALYLTINVAYCLRMKRYAIIDVFFVATGFVLRIFAGGTVAHITLTPWLVLMTFLLALFLAFAKRRDDVAIYEDTGVLPRPGVNGYNLPFMNHVISIIASITMVCYILYTVSDTVVERFQSKHVYLTSIWVLAAIIKYIQITMVDVKSGSPTKVLYQNKFILCCICGWIMHFVCILYF